ncbi:unnamed protein product [Peronospora belbahrii]|uniref:LNR domain-containing protein n=1 Tax=Peronospora belbahrii TaxID=622444 RepID=A0ABN8D001_9STRA|nr:unnamed protein product [Peronospora belbahrii]
MATAPQGRSTALELDSRHSRPCYSYFLPFIFFAGVLATCLTFLLSDWEPLDYNNIGHVKSMDFLSYGPIDVVYTWVNGTDPRWKKEKVFWHKHWIASLTGQPLPVWGQEDIENIRGKDDSNSDNRFRDNEELRYSLRSLEKYAPWIRHVYVVTDGQIPSWLDIESPKISIVKHETIFLNKSHLPVFSSPAIEWNLDNIPGLSDMFLYFNDDVFLGSPVRPEDFVSQAGVQKVYLAWEVPLCADRCFETSLANGRCDKECNVTACDFDMGDCGCDVNPLDGALTCDAEKVATILEHLPKPVKLGDHLCQGVCNYQWLGNGVCDIACNVSSCAFDGGDCKAAKPVYNQYSRTVTPDDDDDDDEEDEEGKDDELSPFVKELWSADVAANHTLVKVPLNVNATYLNLTDAFGVNGSIWTAAHDNEILIRFASVHEAELVLLLVFGRDRDANPMTSSAQISVVGEDAEGNYVCLEFSIVRGNDQIEESLGPAQLPFVWCFRPTPMDMEHVTTILENEKAFPNLSIEDKHATAADKFSSNVPLLEIFLPFDTSGKKLGDGDIVNLGWHVDLRLHNEEKDIDWSEHDICQVQVPKKPEVSTTASAAVYSQKTSRKAAVGGSKHGYSIDWTNTDNDVVPIIGTAIEMMNDENAFEQKNAKQNGEHSEGGLDEDTGAEDLETDDGIAKCRLNEEQSGVFVTFQVLPDRAYTVFSAAATDSGLDGEDIKTDAPQAVEISSTRNAAASTNSDMDKSMDGWKISPQVADGQICFYDTGRDDPTRYRYCFGLAMGYFHSEEVELVHKPTIWALLHPPKPKVIYTPYMGDNPALIELSGGCIDTATRFIGIQPQICYPNEIPVLRLPVKDETKVDLRQQQEEEGRQLACEAQKRRLAQRELKEHEARASDGLLGRLVRYIRSISLAVGFGPVMPADDDSLEYIEYADVCSRLPVAAEEKSETNVQAQLSVDTFGDSLRYVNQLYNRVFGKPKTPGRRRVPSHMPFLLQKSIIREIKDYWTKEVHDTSAHRFRHPQDMQFSFSYFHYLINRAKIHPHTLEEIWREYLDVNLNGILDENEVLTAASLAHGDAPPANFVTEVRECIQSEKRVKVREIPTAEGTLRLSETLTPHITLENLEQCPKIRDALIRNVRYESKVELMPEIEVTFHMLSDDYSFAWKQMMGTRARRTKFVCINDDMRFPSTAVSQILHELFLSIWPKRSQFELPYHLKNRYAHIDEYNTAQERRQVAVWIALMIILLVAFTFRAGLRAVLGFQNIACARAASASQLAQDYQKGDEPHLPTGTKSE